MQITRKNWANKKPFAKGRRGKENILVENKKGCALFRAYFNSMIFNRIFFFLLFYSFAKLFTDYFVSCTWLMREGHWKIPILGETAGWQEG